MGWWLKEHVAWTMGNSWWYHLEMKGGSCIAVCRLLLTKKSWSVCGDLPLNRRVLLQKSLWISSSQSCVESQMPCPSQRKLDFRRTEAIHQKHQVFRLIALEGGGSWPRSAFGAASKSIPEVDTSTKHVVLAWNFMLWSFWDWTEMRTVYL